MQGTVEGAVGSLHSSMVPLHANPPGGAALASSLRACERAAAALPAGSVAAPGTVSHARHCVPQSMSPGAAGQSWRVQGGKRAVGEFSNPVRRFNQRKQSNAGERRWTRTDDGMTRGLDFQCCRDREEQGRTPLPPPCTQQPQTYSAVVACRAKHELGLLTMSTTSRPSPHC